MRLGNCIAGWAIENIHKPETEDMQLNILDKESSKTQNLKTLVIFIRRARAAYGETCLCLSGGAMMVSAVI